VGVSGRGGLSSVKIPLRDLEGPTGKFDAFVKRRSSWGEVEGGGTRIGLNDA